MGAPSSSSPDTAFLPEQEAFGSYRPEIDGLRAVAVCGVILFHTGLSITSGGYVGVDVFFVISGYLITSIITREVDAGGFTILGFYERRVRRIFPALFLVLACTSVAAWFIMSPSELRAFCDSLAATIAFVSNIYFWLNNGYFVGDVEQLPLIQMWSLSVEEQFYIIFPALLLLLAKLGGRRFLNLTFAIGFAVSLAACVYYSRGHRTGGFFLTPARGWELLAGALVAMNQRSWRAPLIGRPRVSRALELVGAAAIVAPIFVYDRQTVFPGVAAIAPVAGAALVILVSSQRSAIGRILASKPFVGVGLVSYSAYLWHQPLFALARVSRLTELGAFVYFFLILATFTLAYLSWRFVEMPFRRREQFSRARIFIASFVLSGALFGVGLLGHFANGFPGRFDRAALALDATSAPSPKRDVCHTAGVNYLPPSKACRYFGGPTHWAVLGDSHGVEIAYALAEQLRPARQSVLQLTFRGCLPALTFESSRPGCSAWLRQSVVYLETAPDISDIVVVFRHSFYLFGQITAYPRQPNQAPEFLRNLPPDQARARYLASFTEMIRRLSAAGKRVYVIKPIPDLPTDVKHYIFPSSWPWLKGERTGVKLHYYRTRNELILSAMEKLRSLPNVTLLDPAAILCDQRQCASIIANKAMYFDDNHFSLEGARRFVAAQRASGALPLSAPPGRPEAR